MRIDTPVVDQFEALKCFPDGSADPAVSGGKVDSLSFAFSCWDRDLTGAIPSYFAAQKFKPRF